jgi:hypothetical protein
MARARHAKCNSVSAMFAFYSNRLGCIGSIAVSLLGTVLLAAILWLMSVR